MLENTGSPTAPMHRYTAMEATAMAGGSMAPAKNTPNTPRVRLTGPMTMLQGAMTQVRAAHKAASVRERVRVCMG